MKKIVLALMVCCAYKSYTKELLISYAKNVYSQFGEDGVVEKIFEMIKPKTRLAVEFGAWDGIHLSNTANLWINNSWHAVLIEGDKKRFEQLAKRAAQFDVIALRAWVGIEKDNTLEALLEKFNIHESIDLLSIDIDGNDYHIFNSLETLKPRVVICEYNPTIPIHYDVYAPYGSENNFGCSVASLIRIARKKGYQLVALTKVNAFFVHMEELEKLSQFETDLRLLDVNDGYITVVTTYDGKYAFIKNEKDVYFYGLTEQMKLSLQGSVKRCDMNHVNLGFTIKPQYTV